MRVTALMSVYNGERYLEEAVESVLGQTFEDFEFIIVDDGSTDRTREILYSYDDPRLHVFYQCPNKGLAVSLNLGITLARYQYIARMDADDVSLPERFERQVAYLDAHPRVGLLGTAALVQDEVGWLDRINLPCSDDRLRRALVRGNPFIHSSVMMRRLVLEEVGRYNPAYPFAQDYDLWIRMAARAQIANLPGALVIHREHAAAVSVTRHADPRTLWRSMRLRVGLRYRAWRTLGGPWTDLRYVLLPVLFAFIERGKANA